MGKGHSLSLNHTAYEEGRQFVNSVRTNSANSNLLKVSTEKALVVTTTAEQTTEETKKTGIILLCYVRLG